MQVIWRSVMNDLNVWIIDQILIMAISPVDPQFTGLRVCGLLRRACNGDNLYVSQASDSIDVMSRDKSGSDDAHTDSLHKWSTRLCAHKYKMSWTTTVLRNVVEH